ncbi:MULTISPECIES: CbiX/SirB N-terminal domain-containing protein [Burkholderiaceae]|uniref:sirohydrochlorin chelatase n=1 Tax=Burkholderiaceae TaxID=119060 RepID=UPI0009678B14|nr:MULTISPECIES: CbiX/SirB N-terminal domain-containing protein [Burkholderiaceae]MCF2133029.1 CbiX/SirB N-terminal domain-containing protein [Mycetohabitans sp. B3]MCG1038483.1 CbiX/SirB N-terminal domain-containing protein [Mycetohabitans sp. B7]SIT80014.1 sirohydrochlorin cobaltochelatase [Burkholderia sp. b14]
MSASSSGLILLGHGARDSRWAEPFERVASLVRVRRRAQQDEGPVSLAFLEWMAPPLQAAIAAQVADGCNRIVVVPMFMGQGGHVQRDLPALLSQARATHPHVHIDCASSVGEDEAVLHALAGYCERALRESR